VGQPIILQPVTAANWRATLALEVHPEQQRFVADYVPIAAIALAKAYVRPGDLRWAPYGIYAAEELVGLIELAYEPGSADRYWIFHFFIDHRHQRRGYGQGALRTFIDLVRDQHPACQRINLQVHPENHRAQSLYRQAGFQPTGTELDGEPVFTLAVR
jgi:diamine N-acetyltransferase